LGGYCNKSLLQKYQKSIEKKSSPQELERIGTNFFISVPLEAFLKVVFIRWAYKSLVLNLLVAV
jgi:hypothetical protein